MAKDSTYIKLIHTSRWLKLRRDILTLHPLCQRCQAGGVITSATEVHHINPVEEAFSIREKEQRMYDSSNLQALCHDCHVKTHTEMGRSGKVAAKQRATKQVNDIVRKFFGGRSGETAPGGCFFNEGRPI